MSLEAKLEANTKAINRLADLLERANVTMPTATEPKAGDWIPQEERVEPTAEAPVEPVASAPTDTEQEASNNDDADAEAATPTTTEEVAETQAAESPVESEKPVDILQVQDAMKNCLSRTKSRDVIVSILDKYGVKRVSDLDSRDLANAKADFEEA